MLGCGGGGRALGLGLVPDQLLPGASRESRNSRTSREEPTLPKPAGVGVPGEGGGKATFILAGKRLLFQTRLSTASSLFQPWPPAKFLSLFLRESRRKRAGLPPALTFPPAINPGAAFGAAAWIPVPALWEWLGGRWGRSPPPSLSPPWPQLGTGRDWWLPGSDIQGWAGLSEHFELKVEEKENPGKSETAPNERWKTWIQEPGETRVPGSSCSQTHIL